MGEPAVELTILRFKELVASGSALTVLLDGEKFVRLRVGRYATLRVPPGQREFTIVVPGGSDASSLIELTTGEPSYILIHSTGVDIGVGVSAGTAGAGSSTSVTHHFGATRITPAKAEGMMRAYERVGED